MSKSNMSRRQFVQLSSTTLLAIPVLGITSYASAAKKAAKKAEKAAPLPEGMTAASESDPVAMAVGYKVNVKDIDFTKYPQRKKPEAKNQFCKNCALYTQVNDSWGKCQLITSGLVSSHGWCGSWSKRP